MNALILTRLAVGTKLVLGTRPSRAWNDTGFVNMSDNLLSFKILKNNKMLEKYICLDYLMPHYGKNKTRSSIISKKSLIVVKQVAEIRGHFLFQCTECGCNGNAIAAQ